MARAWEEYKFGAAQAERLHVTLNPKGEIMIGAMAFGKMGRPDAVVLLYDRETDSIGLKPTHPKTPNSYPMVTKKNGRHRVVRAARFCRDYGIKFDRLMVFNAPKLEGEVLVLELRETRPYRQTNPAIAAVGAERPQT